MKLREAIASQKNPSALTSRCNRGLDVGYQFEYLFSRDRFGLAGGLTFGKLTISQSSSNTLIRITNGGEVLASLIGVNSNLIGAEDFTAV